jgi:hypothetical protein
MSEPTVPTPSQPEGWPPRVPTSPEPVNYPSYPSNESDPAPYAAPASSYQRYYVEKPAEVLEGEQLAKTSTILGIISLFFFGVILGPMAIVKAGKAEKLGVDSTVGKVTGWIGTIMAAISLVVVVIYIFIIGALFAGSSMDSGDRVGTGGFSNSQDYEGSNTYRDMTPAEKDRLDQVAKDAIEQIK